MTAVEIGVYALAATIYLGYLLGLGRSADKVGRLVLGLGIVLHFCDIAARCMHRVNPISSTPEAMSLVAFLIAAGYFLAALRYRLAADYDFMLRALELGEFTAARIARVLVDMGAGGLSSASLRARLR